MKTILIVDDSFFSRSILVQIVEAIGHRTIEAGSGTEAVKIFKEKKPDLVIMDLLMPDMDGIEAIRQILSLDAGAATMICSTDKQKARQEEARQVGVAAFLTKPVDGELLSRKIKAIFNE